MDWASDAEPAAVLLSAFWDDEFSDFGEFSAFCVPPAWSMPWTLIALVNRSRFDFSPWTTPTGELSLDSKPELVWPATSVDWTLESVLVSVGLFAWD